MMAIINSWGDRPGAQLDTTATGTEAAFASSSLKGGAGRAGLRSSTAMEDGGEEANSIACPSPRPSPGSFLAGSGRRLLVLVSRCPHRPDSRPKLRLGGDLARIAR